MIIRILHAMNKSQFPIHPNQLSTILTRLARRNIPRPHRKSQTNQYRLEHRRRRVLFHILRYLWIRDFVYGEPEGCVG